MADDVLTSEEWLTAVARLTQSIGQADFPKALSHALDRIAFTNSKIVLGFRRYAKPVILHDDLSLEERQFFSAGYMGGAYLVAPMYNRFLENKPGGFSAVRGLAPYDEEGHPYSRYYKDFSLADTGHLFIWLTEDNAVVVDFSRDLRYGPFNEEERRCLRRVFPVFQSAIRKHWLTWGQGEEDQAGRSLHEALYRRFERFGASRLTERECEVVRLILKGHSSKSVARVLDISPGTASVHRTNIYRKLEVNSQGDLFARFIDYMLGTCNPASC